MNRPEPETILPLREPTFFILLSLMPGVKHGYAILKDVEALSQGKVRLSTGTLYEALARLLDQGLVERLESSEDDPAEGEETAGRPGKPRKFYRLSMFGEQVIRKEVDRLERLVTVARLRMEGEWTNPSGS